MSIQKELMLKDIKSIRDFLRMYTWDRGCLKRNGSASICGEMYSFEHLVALYSAIRRCYPRADQHFLKARNLDYSRKNGRKLPLIACIDSIAIQELVNFEYRTITTQRTKGGFKLCTEPSSSDNLLRYSEVTPFSVSEGILECRL